MASGELAWHFQNHIVGWMIWTCYSRALERRCLQRIEDDNDDADDDNTLQVSRLPSNWGKCRLGSEEEAAGNFHVQALFAPAGLINRRGRNLTCKVRKTTLIFFRATSERAKFIKRLKHSCSWIAVKLNELSNCRIEKWIRLSILSQSEWRRGAHEQSSNWQVLVSRGGKKAISRNYGGRNLFCKCHQEYHFGRHKNPRWRKIVQMKTVRPLLWNRNLGCRLPSTSHDSHLKLASLERPFFTSPIS